MRRIDVSIEQVTASAYRIPTDGPEADGTLAWNETTLVLVDASGGGKKGLGYTYADASLVPLINGKLCETVKGLDALDPSSCWTAMQRAVRNLGRVGLAAMAISAVETALWDLKAKLLDVPLVSLFGAVRAELPIYGSGGFTNYSDDRLGKQLGDWVERDGCRWVKMKIGSEPERDLQRVEAARSAIGKVGLFVDANGAYSRKQALAFAEDFASLDVLWFEEPVSSDDLKGLRLLRDRAPGGMDIASGEYGFDLVYFERALEAGAVDVLQADITRCGGLTAFLMVDALCQAHQIDLSAHCAPALHLHAACAASRLRHIEWFYDHARIEHMLFDGVPRPAGGSIRPDLSGPGLGVEFKRQDAQRFAVR